MIGSIAFRYFLSLVCDEKLETMLTDVDIESLYRSMNINIYMKFYVGLVTILEAKSMP